MQKIALITDSSCDLDLKTREENNINMFPFRIIYKDKEFLDKITITSEELYDSLEKEVPTTSLPDLNYSNDLIHKLKEEGYTDAIVITISSKVSGTFNSLKLLGEEHDEIDFHFFDSKTIGFPVGALTLQVSKLVNSGLQLDEIMDKIEGLRKRVHGYVTFSTLEFLKKGGRIGRVAGTIGEMLHVKPIISSDEEGSLHSYKRCRGRKQSIANLKSITKEYLQKGKCRVWILNGASDDEATALFNEIKTYENVTDISLETIGASMGVHTGPGAIGVCIFEEEYGA